MTDLTTMTDDELAAHIEKETRATHKALGLSIEAEKPIAGHASALAEAEVNDAPTSEITALKNALAFANQQLGGRRGAAASASTALAPRWMSSRVVRSHG